MNLHYAVDRLYEVGWLPTYEQDLERLEDGRRFTLTPGMSYHVADGAEAHRSRSRGGARLFVVD